jgi:hypothetical protein
VGTGKQYKHRPLGDRKSQLLDAASHCRRLAGGLRNLEAIGMIALAYEFEDRASFEIDCDPRAAVAEAPTASALR